MATQTDILKLRIPSPDGSDPADLAEIIGNLGEDVDAAVGSPAMTTSQINALTGDEKKAGRRVWDSTLGVEKVSDGTSWVTIRPLDSAGHLPMGGKRITGLADAASATDAATKAQLDAVSTVANAALPQAGGHISGILTMGNNIVMGSNRITQLPPGDLAGDAVNKSQLDGVAAAIPKGGRALATFDAAGNASITHGWGSTPAWAQLTVENPYGIFPHLVSISSTVINVRASEAEGILTSASVWMHWLVGG